MERYEERSVERDGQGRGVEDGGGGGERNKEGIPYNKDELKDIVALSGRNNPIGRR